LLLFSCIKKSFLWLFVVALSLVVFDVDPAYAVKRPHLKTPKVLKNAEDKVKKGAKEAGGKIEKAFKKALDKGYRGGEQSP